MQKTIIEKDLFFYKCCLETANNNLRRCLPNREVYYKKEIEMLEAIIEKLQLYFDVFVSDNLQPSLNL